MSELDEIIEMNVTVTDQAPERPNFGVPLIASFHEQFGDRVREYSQPDDLLDDGFTTLSPEYAIATAMKAQNPTVQRFKLGRLTGSFNHTLHLIPANLTVGYVYEFEVRASSNDAWVTVSYEVQNGDDAELIVDGIVADLAAAADITATDATTHATLAADNAGDIIYLRMPQDGHLRVLDATVTSGSTLASDLAAIEDEDPAWYGLILALNTEDTILAAATWCEARTKNFFPQSADWNVVDTGEDSDVASQLLDGAYTRTCGIWKRNVGGADWAAAAFAIQNLAPDPGSYTPAFKTLATIPVDKLRPGERTALKNKHWTRYTRVGGLNITYEGRTPSGRFIDVVRGIDWIKSEIQLDLYRYLYVNPKVPFSASGLAGAQGVVENAIRKGLPTAGNPGLVADDSPIVVEVPAIEETDVSDRANRLLRSISFSFRLSGALHGIRVVGTASV